MTDKTKRRSFIGATLLVFFSVWAFGVRLFHSMDDRAAELTASRDAAEAQLQSLISGDIPLPSVHCDQRGVIKFANDQFTELTGLAVGDSIDKMIPEAYRTRHHAGMTDAIAENAAGGKRSYTDSDRWAIGADGEPMHVRVHAWTTGSGAMAIIWIISDATDSESAQRDIRQATSH